MATTRPFAFNTGATIPGTIQVGDFAIGVSEQDYSLSPGGVTWYMGPDEDNTFVIAVATGGQNFVFHGSNNYTSQRFISLCNILNRQQGGPGTFTGTTDAGNWLDESGFWTNFDVLTADFGNIFTALWISVDGTEMIDTFGGEPLTLSSDPGVSYIPFDYSGTITAPDVQALKDADVDNVLYDALGVSKNISASFLVASDIPRIPVKYDNFAPHHIRTIGIIDPDAYLTLSITEKKRISDYLDLWVFFWGGWLDAGSVNKENRTF